MPLRETPEQAGLKVIRQNDHALIAQDVDTGKHELWSLNDGHASYGLRVDGHDWEFVRSVSDDYDLDQ